MFKRANKVTALLVAAASIMSVVPAMASERIGTKDGTVKQGISYTDGQYGYYGYRTDDDDTGIWYNKGGDTKDTSNDDLEDYNYDNASKYGEKYAFAHSDSNNDDEYLIDLSTGKIVDDETPEDLQDTAKSKLQSALKKADRFNGLDDVDGDFDIADADFERILTGQFGEVWYQYTTDKAVYDNTTTNAVVFTNKDAKYIDASYTANVRVYSSKRQRAILIEEYNKVDKDAALEVSLKSIKPIAQDKDNIYTITTVSVLDSYNGNTTAHDQYFIQKISKARGDKEDGAYTPKEVTSYQIDNKTIYDNGDAKDAYDVLFTTNSDYDVDNNLYAVRDGKLYVTQIKDEKVKVWTLSLSKAKVDVFAGAVTNNVAADDVDTYLVKKTEDDDHDLTDLNNLDPKADEASKILNSAVSIDTEGYTWALDKGKIYKYTDGSFKEMYTVDRAMDSLDVYADGNLIAWDSEGDAYTTVQEGKKQTVTDATVVDPTLGQTTPATVGWKQEATGWTFYDVNGTKVANYWVNDNGTWYYIKADGIMATGWQQVNGTWYYLKANGAMATGWLNDNGTWYYLASSGAMLANTTVDGYKLGASGAWIQ